MTIAIDMGKNNSDVGKFRNRGFSLVEVLMVIFVIIILAAMAIPKLTTLLGNLKTRGDARDLNAAIVLARMRAASDFARARVYADLSANTFRVEVLQSGAAGWQTDGCPNSCTGNQLLSKSVTFGYGSLTAPPNGVASLTQAPLCLQDDPTSTYANTACIMFNSRGIPIGSNSAPTSVDALYVTDGKSVTGVTISATGLTKIWRSDASTANWNPY
jgi:prepilin-type N-terminal cleavage/methylation domain-containing protein